MSGFVFVAAVASTFTLYPGASDGGSPIEAITDRGVLVELIVRCPAGTAIISYSKGDHRYCTPKFWCDESFDVVYERTCL